MPINSPDAAPGINGTVFTGLTTNITTVGAAVNYWAEQLRRRLDLRTVLVVAQGAGILYNLTVGHHAVTWTFSSSTGAMPMYVVYTSPHGTGSAFFDTVSAAIDWLVERLVS
jgi:hypothetical protein